MKTKPYIRVISWVALVGVTLTGGMLIPTAKAPAETGPDVARVSIVDGSAVIQRGDSHTQTNAVRNAPMLPGDYISTGKTSRSELQFDGYTALRLGGNVQARITSNDANNRKIQLADGTVEIGMVHDGQTIAVDTPSVSVRTHEAGDYRVSIASDGSSWITARKGSAEVVTPQQTYTLDESKTLVARGSASRPAIADGAEPTLDSFDDFNVQRDKTMVAALNASPSLNPILAGYDNLSAYGRWQAVAGYGQSWVPNEPSGWAPYRNGSWAWEDGYGWTWVGSEPWGWTPYHYGNWYYCDCGGSGWAWLPPASSKTPAWSPALVGFFGFDVASTGGYNNCGGNYGYAPESAGYVAPSGNGPPEAPYSQGGPAAAPSSGAPAPYGEGGPAPNNAAAPAPYGEGGPGNYAPPAAPYGSGYPPPAYGQPYPYIGWVPIAPYEPFYPWYPGWAWLGFGWGVPFFGGYGYPGAFATNITRIVNITNVNRIYRNFRHGGASGTSLRNFRHGTLYGHTLAVRPRDIGRHFGTIHGAVPVAPTRDNLRFSRGTPRAPVTFSKAFDSPRFASDRGLAAQTSFPRQQKAVAQAIHDGLTGRVIAHQAVHRANASVSQLRRPETHVKAAISRANGSNNRVSAFQTHRNSAVARQNAVSSHQFETARRENAPIRRQDARMMRQNAAPSRQIEATRRENIAPSRQVEATRGESAPVSRENAAPTMRANAPMMRGDTRATIRGANSPMIRAQNSEMREGAAAPRQVDAGRQFAPTSSWQRFNETRGASGSAEFPSGVERGASGVRQSEISAPSEGAREDRTTTDSWGRFSTSRGESAEGARNPYGDRQSNPYYTHDTPSYSRGSYASPYSRESAPSYSRGTYPSYSRGSYPPYSRGSYPSYSRGSYPSYSRESYPSFSRGSSPSYPRANSAPPQRSSGGGGAAGSAGGRHGGGRPPQSKS